MRKFALAVAVVLAFSWFSVLAQQAPPASAPPPDAKKDAEKDTKDTKKKKDKNKHQGVDDSPIFSPEVANSLLSDLRDGLEGHSQRLVLSAFDQDKMDGYLTFEDQIEAMMQRYDSFRVHFSITQSMIEGPKGVVLADWEMEEIPRTGGAPIRRNGQVKFEMERGRKGWKIVDFHPRGFLS